MGELAEDRGPTDVALLDDTIPANLERAIEHYPDHEALVAVHQDIRWTYRQFGDHVRDIAKSL
ncbi:MAG: AMP-binding protein, partial [Ilumatobacter fluminis]